MNSTVQRLNSVVPVSMNPVTPGNTGGLHIALYIFVAFLVVFLVVYSMYYDAFMSSIQNWSESVSSWFTGKTPSNFEPPRQDIVTAPPIAPQDERATRPSGTESMVEKLLPPAKEVFTVSKNDYTYYDAAPLCKALGAQLASFDEVKDAWRQGADWCNYGWVKGQMAVYPTQKGTYEELQMGPDDQKGACGKVGLNGGYFDNPELKFGVTCVGKRPSQSQHDVNAITSGSTRPLTASGIEFEKKVMRFKDESDSLGILPFNKERWSS